MFHPSTLLALFLTVHFLPTEAMAAECDRALLGGIDFVDYEKRPIPLDFCTEPKGLQNQFVQALHFLTTISKENLAKGAHDQGIIQNSPLKYFKSQVRFVLTLKCPMPAQRNDEDSISICPAFAGLDPLTQAEVLLHEARHRENGNRHRHVACGAQAGELQGKPGCDEKYEDAGSYAVSAEFYLKVWRAPLSKGISKALRQSAKKRALYYLNCRMNQPFTSLNEGPINCDESASELFKP